MLVGGVFADFVGGSLAEAGHARSKEPEGIGTKETSAGLRHAHAWIEVQSRDSDAESGQRLAKPLPNSSLAVLRMKLGPPIPTARPRWW